MNVWEEDGVGMVRRVVDAGVGDAGFGGARFSGAHVEYASIAVVDEDEGEK
jgi:hypothetical protein